MGRSRSLLAVGAAVVLLGAGTGVIPLQKLTLDERLRTAPNSAQVAIGKRTYPLGALRTAHRVRELQITKINAVGASIGHQLLNQKPTPIHVSNVAGGSIAKGGSLNITTTNAVVEPASQYASAPGDMKAFCASAQASACIYLPPQQADVQAWQGKILDGDTLIDQSQCTSEGGQWGTFLLGSPYCGFLYPSGLTVHFTPASNYKASSTAQCDSSWWTYTVDPRGAIQIQITTNAAYNLALVGAWNYQGPATGSAPWCVVHVTLGS